MTYRYVSLFSGAGGLDLGLKRAGCIPGLMNDEDRPACETLRAQGYGTAVVQGDIHDLLNAGAVGKAAAAGKFTLVAGQVPLLPRRGNNAAVDPDEEAPQLMYRFMDAVEQARPAAFIMAALPAVASRKWDAVRARLRHTARDLGYDTFAPVIDAADFGVPQHRTRWFFTGMPRGCKPDDGAAHRPDKVSAGAALRALDHSAARDIPCMAGVTLAKVPVLRNSPYSGNLLSGTGRIIDLRKVAPVLPAVLGGNKTPVIDWTQLDFGSTPHIEGYHDYLWRERGEPGRYKYAGDVVKYMRRLSLRECAALQGFPSDYPFRGPAVTQFKLVGTALPPALGEAVWRTVLAGLS